MSARSESPAGGGGGQAPPVLEPSRRVTASTPLSATPTTAELRRVCPTCQSRYPADFNVCPRDATPLDEISDEDYDELLGAVLGDAFLIVRAVGEGGMARVYEARHVRLANKRFAVKVLHASYAHQPEVVVRFQREAEAASGINHPNVVDVYDVHKTADGRPYLVSEFLEGHDFSDFLDERGKIDVLLAIGIMRQLCRALVAAHERGVVHRDMKPENIFLVGDDNAPIVKVLDFGISKIADAGEANLTRTGMVMGTPAYMAPEQARGARVDHRVDIYSVGAVLYRALTGHLPFDGEDATEVLSLVLTEEPPRPRSIEPAIPEALEVVMQKAMAKDPKDRYRTMAEFDAELEPFGAEARALSLIPPEPGSGVHQRLPAAVSTSAKTVLSAGAPSVAVSRATREAKLARPTIVMLSLALYAWLGACVFDAGAAILRMTRGDVVAVSVSESVLIGIGILALSITPVVFWIRHIVRNVWENSVRALALASELRRITLAVSISYAVMMIVIRLSSSVGIVGGGSGAAFWSLVLLACTLVAGLLAFVLGRAKR